MPGIRIQPHQAGPLARKINRATKAALRRGVNRGVTRSRRLMVKRTPVDQGQMKASWKVKRYPVKQGGNKLATLINDAPYAGVIEGGARRHVIGRRGWVSIYYWVYRNRHLFIFGPKRRGRGINVIRDTTSARSGATLVEYDPTLEAITWGIWAKIKHKGQKGKWIMRKALPQHRTFARQEIQEAIKRLSRNPPTPSTRGGGKGGS